MALDINGYNATFKAFTDFATQSVEAGKSKAVARAGGGVDKTEHWRGILNAFQVAERERGETAAEEVLLDAIHGGNGGFMRV